MGSASFDFDPSLADVRRRRGNKWRRFGPDVLAAWVADMDFAPAPPVADALRDAIARGDLGYYGDRLDDVATAAARWQRSHHDLDLDTDRVLVVDDVIGAMCACLGAFTRPGSTAIVPVPIYPPFYEAVAHSPAELAPAPLRIGDHGWELDLPRVAELAPRASTILLCNPHNPTGAVLARSELEALAEIACAHDLVVITDEVWADVVHAPNVHVPIATLGTAIAARTVTLTSASKTFNLGGLRCAVAHFGTDDLLDRVRASTGPLLPSSNGLGVDATIAAWQAGDEWRHALLEVLEANRNRVDDALAEVDGVECHSPAGTYLAWIDCTGLRLSRPAASHLLEHGRVALSPGEAFEPAAASWCRLNFATGATLLDAILERVVSALRAHRP